MPVTSIEARPALRALPVRSTIDLAMSAMLRSPAALMTGVVSSLSVSTAMPMFSVSK